MTDAPLRDGADALRVNRLEIENETFNVIETHGYNLERNFGHGRETLASAPVALDPPAFAIHTAGDLIEAAWRRATGTRMRLFERLRAIAACHVFPSRRALMTTLRASRRRQSLTPSQPAPSGRNAGPTHNPYKHRTMTRRQRPQP